MEENKKKNKGLIITILVLFVLVFTMLVYVVIGKVKYDKSNNLDNSKSTTKNQNIDNSIDYSDYLTYDFSSKDKFKPADTINDEFVSEFKLIESIDFLIKYDETNKKAFFVLDNKNYDISISDIKHVYAYLNGCSEGVFSIYILTSSGDVYSLKSSKFYDSYDLQESIKDKISNNIAKMQNSFEKLNKNNKYEKLAEVTYDVGTECGYVYDMIGYDNNNIPYKLSNEEKFVEECSYYLGMGADYCIDLEGKVYDFEYSGGERIDKKLTNIKIKNVIGKSYMEAIMLDENNNLYQYGQMSGVDGISKVKESKVKKIYYKTSGYETKYIVIFEDDSKEEFSINN